MNYIEMEYMGDVKSCLLGVLLMIFFVYVIRDRIKSIVVEDQYKEAFPKSKVSYKTYKFIVYGLNSLLLIGPLFILFIWSITLLDLPRVLTKDYETITAEITGLSSRADVIFISELDTGERFRIETERDGLTVGQVVVIEYLPYTRAGQVVETIE